MPFVYPNPLMLVGKATVGDGAYKGECAAIAQFLVPGLGSAHVALWKRGAQVQGNCNLLSGTVIAIFDSNSDSASGVLKGGQAVAFAGVGRKRAVIADSGGPWGGV